MKLHIGCGFRNLPGYKHFDIRKLDEHIDYVGSAQDLSQFPDGSIEEIYACHLLEHFGRNQVNEVLKEWYRVICPGGGQIRIAVPDFGAVVEEYRNTHDLFPLSGLLYGGQEYGFHFHYVTFDFDSLRKRLEDVGFVDVRRYDWKEFLPKEYDDCSRAYLPHMDFENGRLMSLNVVARKR